jgi:Ca2+-binding RTX toxin-like protein
VIGGAGATAIESGLGNQTLVAGGGPTLFEILAGVADRAITISDFNPTQDFVQLQGYGAGAGATALTTATISGGGEAIALTDGTTITFQGITNVSASSFL